MPNPDAIELLKKSKSCQMCNRQSIATKIGQNDMNGMKLRVCDECFNSWTSRCKVSVIYEFPADRTNEKLLEASVVS